MGPGQDQTRDPGSAVRHVSAVWHVTDCAKLPGIDKFLFSLINEFLISSFCNINILIMDDKYTVLSLYNTPHYNINLNIIWSCCGSHFFNHEILQRNKIGKKP